MELKNKVEFEAELCTNIEHIIAEMHKILLRFGMEEEQVK